MTKTKIDRLYSTVHVKDQVLGNVFGDVFFRLLSIKYLTTSTVRTSCRQFPARSGIFCLLVDVAYIPSGLKCVYPMINLTFLGIIVKVKLLAKFFLHDFE